MVWFPDLASVVWTHRLKQHFTNVPAKGSQSLTCNINRAWLMEQFLWQCGFASQSKLGHTAVRVRLRMTGGLKPDALNFESRLSLRLFTPVAGRAIVNRNNMFLAFVCRTNSVKSVWKKKIVTDECWYRHVGGKGLVWLDFQLIEKEDHEICWAEYLGGLTAFS